MDLERLERGVREQLREQRGLEGLERDEPLLSTGCIDSVDVARIATFLEERTGLTIPDHDLVAAHFDSIAAMLAYVEARLAR